MRWGGYQFWQSKKKDEVNRSEVKIGADEIAAVTQLFTEPYMVEFLLHNTLGAWWAGKTLTVNDTADARLKMNCVANLRCRGSAGNTCASLAVQTQERAVSQPRAPSMAGPKPLRN